MRKIVLCILDGVGIRNETYGNAVYHANMPNFDTLMKEYPASLLEASGSFVGLPSDQMGNSEVGHSNIGAGRILYQPLTMINNSIKDKSFFRNTEILDIINHVKNNNSSLHICGLLSDGGVHSNINHLMSLIDMAKENNIEKLYFHLFMDGRDTKVDSGINYIKELNKKIINTNYKIASISGRFYAMDRDNRWDRIEKSYNVMVKGIGSIKEDPEKYIEDSYKNGIFDEFIEPVIINKDGMIKENDGIITFNFRPDRLREIFTSITNNDFNEFDTIKFNNIKLVTMFPVADTVICTNAFHHQDLTNTLGEFLENKNLMQLRIAETEKYAHVTFFFDGGQDIEYLGKDQILIPSPKVATYDLMPQMSAYTITDTLIKELDKEKYDVVILNYANGDMVGHTGNMDKTIEALEHLDKCLGLLYNKCIEKNYTLIVTADHGNSDYMIDSENRPVTTHSMSKVPFIVTKKDIKLKNGALSDIAPTIIDLLEFEKPQEMTGISLIEK